MHRADPTSGGWGEAEHLQAHLIDRIDALLEMTRAANSEDHTYNPPQRFPRPADWRKREAERRAQAESEAHMRAWWRGIEQQIAERG